jgi:hypothetical protein
VGEEKTVLVFSEEVQEAADEIIIHFGATNQLNKALEEANEYKYSLIQLRDFFSQHDCGTCDANCCAYSEQIKPMIDETADILFTAFQVAKIIGLEKVIERIKFKAKRTIERINA